MKKKRSTKKNLLTTGGLTNPRPWRGRCRAGYSNTGGPPLPQKRAPYTKKNLLRLIQGQLLFSYHYSLFGTCSSGLRGHLFFQCASSLRSEGGPRPNRLWTSSAPGAEKGLFRTRVHPAPCLHLSLAPPLNSRCMCELRKARAHA